MVLICSRRSRIFLKRGPLSCGVPSRRDSVGGGGSRIFSWSPNADAVHWGAGVVAECFRDLQEPTRFSGGGVVAVVAEIFFSVAYKV